MRECVWDFLYAVSFRSSSSSSFSFDFRCPLLKGKENKLYKQEEHEWSIFATNTQTHIQSKERTFISLTNCYNLCNITTWCVDLVAYMYIRFSYRHFRGSFKRNEIIDDSKKEEKQKTKKKTKLPQIRPWQYKEIMDLYAVSFKCNKNVAQ